MDEKLVWQALPEVIGTMIVVALAAASGVMPWAIFAGAGTFLLTGIGLREWYAAVIAGVVATGIVSVLGIVAMLSPGWYKGLL